MTKTLVILAVLVGVAAHAADEKGKAAGKKKGAEQQATPPAPPPEIAKTVAHFAGNWRLDAELALPGMKEPVKFILPLDCEKTAGDSAVRCITKTEIPGVAPFEQAYLAGYDPHQKAVRFIAWNNFGDIHDHAGEWTGSTIKFPPYKLPDGGVEKFSMEWSDGGKTLLFKSTTISGGKTTTFTGEGQRAN